MDADLRQDAIGRRHPRRAARGDGRFGRLRVALRALAAVAVAGLFVLLAYGIIVRNPQTSIDADLDRSRPVPAPAYRLAVLRHGALGARLERAVAPALADGRVSPAELRGTPYVLNFWASWCVPCREEAPLLRRAWHSARPRAVLFVGLDTQDTSEDARRFMDRFGLDYLNLRDPTNDTARRYGAKGLPETFFITAQGDIVAHVIGVVTPKQLSDGIKAAVDQRPQASRRGGDRRPTR